MVLWVISSHLTLGNVERSAWVAVVETSLLRTMMVQDDATRLRATWLSVLL